MSSIETCTRNTPREVEPGVLNGSSPDDSSGLHIQGINLGNASLSSTSNVLDTSKDTEASGIPVEAPLGSQLQQFHASKPTHAYHQRSASSSSNEGELAKAPYITVGENEVTGGSTSGASANDMAGLNEADAALLISPIISRTQSTTFYDPRRSGSAAGVHRPSMADVEDIEDDTDIHRYPPRVVINHASSIPLDFTKKEQKMGVLSSAAHRLSTVSGLYLTSKSGPGRHSPPEGDSGTSTPKNTARKSSMFTFTLPSFHLPQMPSPPSFLSDITTRKRSKSNVLGNPFSKPPNQSQRNSFFGKPTTTDRSISPTGHSLQGPPLTPLRRSSSQPSLSSYNSSLDETRFANVQSMTNARIKAIKDNFRGLSPGNTIASAANALSTYANSLNSALSSASPLSNSESATSSMGPALPPVKPHPLDTVEGDIVVMGGYRGSILREASGQRRRVWIPLRVGLNLRKVNLEIGLDEEDEETMSQRIIPDGMLTHIGPVDIGRRLLRRLRLGEGAGGKKHPRRVWEYGYDWRLSPHILSKQLIEYLEKLPCNQGSDHGQPRQPGRGALVIAHSLGGLIVRHAINQRPELFSGVLFVGTPQHCVNILGPLRNGDTVLLSSRVLTAQVNFTLRSSYVLLPEDGHCFVDKKTGKKINMDLFDVNTWIKYALSPCVVENSPTPPSLHLMNGGVGEAAKEVAREGVSIATRDRTLAPQIDSTSSTLNPFSHIPSFLEETVCTLPTSETIPYLDRTLKAIKQFKEELRFKPEIGYPPEKGKQSEAPVASPVPIMHSWDGDEITSNDSSATIAPISSSTMAPSVSMEESKSVYYPPMAIMYAKNTPTVKGARVDGIESISQDNVYDDLFFGAGKSHLLPLIYGEGPVANFVILGDGVCLAKAAQLPPGYKACAKVLSDRGHISLLGDLDNVGKAIEGIVGGRGW